ncbi:MAG: Alpha/beta fold hydrolase [Deltaproteobacteria bacterium]|nr:Alpha/beta fold hydrolase [Deltaproteobacteria bacterium]
MSNGFHAATPCESDTETQSFESFFLSYWNRVKRVAIVDEEPISFSNSHGDTLVGMLHHPAKSNLAGAAILCHGMESDKNSTKLIFLSQQLAQRGILTLRFDFSYVGESSGKFEDITYSGEVEDLRAAYALMRNRHDGKIAIFGSSMGGTVALMFAAAEPQVAALVTLAAPLHPENFPKRVLPPAGLERWRRRGYTRFNGQRLNVTMLEDLESIDVPGAARKIRCPVLILHGDADEVVAVAEAHELHGCLTSSKRLSILKDGDHHLSDPIIMQRAMHEALDWLTDHVR